MAKGMIEGAGTFEDSRDPNKVFKTTDPKIWEKHLKETGVTFSGEIPCVICGNQTIVENQLHSQKVVCDSCKKELV